MKNLVIGVAVGALATYVVYKLAKEGKLDCLCDDANMLANKTKQKIKDGLDIAQNNIEYLEDRLKFKTQEVKDTIEGISNKVSGKNVDKANG